MHQLIKLSTRSVLGLLLMCCGWATTEGQSVRTQLEYLSSRVGSSNQQTEPIQIAEQAKQAKHQVRVDTGLGQPEQTSFVAQEKDGASGGDAADQAGWATTEGQSVRTLLKYRSSRIGYSKKQAKSVQTRKQTKQAEQVQNAEQTKQVKHQIRVDSSLGQSGQARFIVQEKDVVSGGGAADQADEPPKTDDLLLSPSSPEPKDDDLDLDDSLDDDLELDDDLSMDDEQDRRPARPEFGPWPKKGIRGIKVDIRETNSNSPEDVSEQLIASNRSDWTQFAPQQKVFAWVAPEIKYQPLYFEDVALERYGTTAGPYHQSLISGFHFFKDFVFLPHKMRHDAPSSCDYPLGFCRPGNSTPYSIQRHYFGRPGQ